MQPLDVRVLPVSDLVPAPYNPRKKLKPTDPAYRKLAASLREFGLVEPLVWNELTGHVVGGHARLAILREQGVTEVSVSVVRLTPEREKALNVVLNNREAQADFDPTKLSELLVELAPLPELEMTGFTLATLRHLDLEPLVLDREPAVPPGRVSVALEMDDAVFDEITPTLDSLVRDHGVRSHVRRGKATR